MALAATGGFFLGVLRYFNGDGVLDVIEAIVGFILFAGTAAPIVALCYWRHRRDDLIVQPPAAVAQSALVSLISAGLFALLCNFAAVICAAMLAWA